MLYSWFAWYFLFVFHFTELASLDSGFLVIFIFSVLSTSRNVQKLMTVKPYKNIFHNGELLASFRKGCNSSIMEFAVVCIFKERQMLENFSDQ